MSSWQGVISLKLPKNDFLIKYFSFYIILKEQYPRGFSTLVLITKV